MYLDNDCAISSIPNIQYITDLFFHFNERYVLMVIVLQIQQQKLLAIQQGTYFLLKAIIKKFS